MKTKANIGIALVIAFVITLTIGVILHLKSHGIVVQPRGALLFIHWTQFGKTLNALKKRFRWFYADTVLLIILFIATLLTGSVKLLSPVKIPHLGLWHYGLGIAMSITIVIHLFRGIPTWNRLRKSRR